MAVHEVVPGRLCRTAHAVDVVVGQTADDGLTAPDGSRRPRRRNYRMPYQGPSRRASRTRLVDLDKLGILPASATSAKKGHWPAFRSFRVDLQSGGFDDYYD
jgi:hypothetical protein